MGNSKNVVILAGAGASYAVNPKKYPTTQHFYDNLPETLTSNPVISQVMGFLERGGLVVDIELVLWELKKAQEFFSVGGDKKTFIGSMLASGFFAKTAGISDPNNAPARVARAVLPHLSTAHEAVNTLVYNFYSQTPEQLETRENWVYLLERLGMEGVKQPDIATTNYDSVIENALEWSHSDTRIGVTAEYRRKLDIDSYISAMSNDGAGARGGLLGKLHGSLDWIRQPGSDAILVGDPVFHNDHALHAIIYPGFKGAVTDEPFVTLHNWFGRAIGRAHALLVIGFAFRDEYLNDVLLRELNRGAEVIIIDPGEPNIPLGFDSSRLTHVREGFGRSAVDRALSKICSA